MNEFKDRAAARARGQALRSARVARSRSIRRRIIGGSVALFVAAWLMITLVLVSGHDPALAKKSSGSSSSPATVASTPATSTTSSGDSSTTSSNSASSDSSSSSGLNSSSSGSGSSSSNSGSSSSNSGSSSSNTGASSVTTSQS